MLAHWQLGQNRQGRHRSWLRSLQGPSVVHNNRLKECWALRPPDSFPPGLGIHDHATRDRSRYECGSELSGCSRRRASLEIGQPRYVFLNAAAVSAADWEVPKDRRPSRDNIGLEAVAFEPTRFALLRVRKTPGGFPPGALTRHP